MNSKLGRRVARGALALALVAAASLTPSTGVHPAGAHHVYEPDYCTVRDVITPYRAQADHDLTVLDWTYMVPSNHVPPDLVRASLAGFTGGSGDKLVRRAVVSDLAALRRAAAAAGHTLLIQSAYRSYSSQRATFDHWVATSGYQAALLASARPGHSEHQLGTGFDFTSSGLTPWEHPDWATTPLGSWLAANAWRYGFVMSYPKGMTAKTCYQYEPWHYRWIGRASAVAQRTSTLTLREYLDARLHARFVDMRWTPFEGDIGWLASQKITSGCRSNPARFCPDAGVTREQMASFLSRALGLTEGGSIDYFDDDNASAHETDINRVAHAGITGGCAERRYCPSATLTREQMASFLSRALRLTAGGSIDFFTDDDTSAHETNINRLAYAGVTGGCEVGKYCPTADVTRGQMAAFLRRAFE